jgi:hypothetical protein
MAEPTAGLHPATTGNQQITFFPGGHQHRDQESVALNRVGEVLQLQVAFSVTQRKVIIDSVEGDIEERVYRGHGLVSDIPV